MIRSVIFILVSIGLAYLSRHSFVRPWKHGFYRFFAWELLLGLFLLALPRWIDTPLSPRQLFSWALITISAYLALRGIYLLRASGRPDPERENPNLFHFEKTSCLVTDGIYRYIRHPLYSSLLFLAWGLFLKRPAGLEMALAMGSSLFLILTAMADENECLAYFGQDYRAYMRRSWRFIPLLF